MRVSVTHFAEQLGALRESVIFTCNKVGISTDGGHFELPDRDTPAYRRFMKVLASRPSNPAERMLRDLGCRPPRV